MPILSLSWTEWIVLIVIFLNVSVVVSSVSQSVTIDGKWRVFGPLPLGGVGADPLAVLPGTVFEALEFLKKFPSEAALGGYATWNSLTANASTGVVQANYTGSDAPMTAWAVGKLHLEEPPTDGSMFVLLHCTHRTYLTPASPPAPDEPKRHHCMGGTPCALSLRSRTYTIHTSLTSYVNPVVEFGCEVKANNTEPLLLPGPGIVKPSVIVHNGKLALAGSYASVTVLNADEENWATAGAVTVVSEPAGVSIAPLSPHPPRLSPGQVRAIRLDLDVSGVPVSVKRRIAVNVTVSYSVNSDTREVNFSLPLEVLMWPPSSYTATYIDVDGTPQAVALKPPSGPCPSGWCSVLLSTHGAGVDALAGPWTGAYLTQQGAFVLLPTGRRVFGSNWEGPQLLSALKSLEQVRENLPGVPKVLAEIFRIRRDWVMISGHSMGGHGAITLSTHFPDLLVGSLPASGWLRYDQYGFTGPAFEPQVSFSDAGLRALFKLSTEEYDGDLYAENLVGIPLLARSGSDDETVPPANLRKFVRLLRTYELYRNITESLVDYNEVKGKGHWWYGVVDDKRLQPFIAKVLKMEKKPVLPLKFSLVTQNPASTGSRGGLSIQMLRIPFQTGRISVTRRDVDTWEVQTQNVRRLRYRAINGLYPRPKRLVLDGSEPALHIPSAIRNHNSTSEAYVDLCGEFECGNFVWTHCTDSSFPSRDALVRGPDNSGPFSSVIANRRVAIIYPVKDASLLGLATRLSNALFKMGVTSVVTADESAARLIEQGSHNVVVLGGSDTNVAAEVLQEISKGRTARTYEGEICIASWCTKRPGTGIAYLTPGKYRSLAVIVAGTDDEGLSAAASFLPLSPEQKIPEWVIVNTKDGFGWRGLGGVVAAGYWNHEWKVETALSYPATWASQLTEVERIRNETRRRSGAFGAVSFMIVLIALFCLVRRLRPRKALPQEGETEAFIVDSNDGRQ